MKYLILFSLLSVAITTKAQDNATPNSSTDTIFSNSSHVDFDRFLELAQEVRDHRAERLVSWTGFQEMSREPNTIILDTRSKEMYDRSHIKGAVHLNFADFNVWSLQKIVPDPNTRILIYCNNNFDYPSINWSTINAPEAIVMPYVSKGTPIVPAPIDFEAIQQGESVGGESIPYFDLEDLEDHETVILSEPTDYEPAEFPLTMALNVPTYINLYGYGYQNVYELADLISMDFSGIVFEGTDHQPVNPE